MRQIGFLEIMPAHPVLIEQVERRLLLSTVAHPAKHPTAPKLPTASPVAESVYVGGATTAAAQGHAAAKKVVKTAKRKGESSSVAPDAIAGSTTPDGKTPDQMRAAYGLGASGSALSYPITFNGTAGDGTGQTIAIIDCYDDPNAISDLQGFSAHFGLPNAPSFQVLNEYGTTTRPATDPAGADNQAGTWEEEESLDIEWAHAIAPGASLILYEAASTSFSDLDQAVETAEANPAVSIVSMSFGTPEWSGEVADNADFTTPASRASAGGVTFLASTGDDGAGVASPSSSPSVIAVGGTTLQQATSGAYTSESAWSGGGGGISTYESQPAYQAGTVSAYSTTKRTVPDVAMDADPTTGVPIYDSYDFGASTPWLGGGYVEGGTSLACPMWAGLVAIADQGRVAEGLPSLASDSYTHAGTLTRLYQLPGADFHDVTTGSDGANAAAVGYDLTTGRGSPVANTLVPDLAGAATITGRLFVDANGNTTYDAGTDTPLAGQTVYLDLNNDGHLDNGEPSTTTAADGTYTFADEPAGGTIGLANSTPVGYQAVATTTSAMVTYGATDTVNFAFFPTTYTGSHYTLQTNSAGTVDQVLLNGTVVDSIAKGSLTSSLLFHLTGSAAGLTINAANGNPLVSAGVVVAVAGVLHQHVGGRDGLAVEARVDRRRADGVLDHAKSGQASGVRGGGG
jgi:subtilase family serine protease